MPVEIFDTFSYRHAEAILIQSYSADFEEIKDAITSAKWAVVNPPKVRKRKGKVVATIDIDQIATNKNIEQQFSARGWEPRRRIVSNSPSHLAADFNKNAIQVEVQFGNAARWYADVFKFLLSYAADDIEVGVLVVPMHSTAVRIDENIISYERVLRVLPQERQGDRGADRAWYY